MNPNSIVRKVFSTCRRLLVDKSLKELAPINEENILVVGAGRDPYRSIFGKYKKYVKLDLFDYGDSEMVIGNAENLPFEDQSFDVILATEVFEHLSNPNKLILEAYRVLKKNGKIIITVPFLYHQHGDPFDFWRPTKNCLNHLLNGKFDYEIWTHGNRLHVISDLITTAFYPWNFMIPFRILNHLFVLYPNSVDKRRKSSSANTGYLIQAVKL